eukprot:TRINITY_DN51051_c0_g1_i1.p1 TRINITY_DN51051_c0_g1~~TRINITY_DN51051_c0_g1_i1.p1  ORF type:complete len:251 (-),score=33.72 TRINITY_DN51051_c0_g1_i1:42-794(-)
MRGHVCGVAPHAFCGGCQLVLPNRAFSAAQVGIGADDIRRCKACVGSAGLLRCASCEGVFSPRQYSFAQKRRGAGLQRCRACVEASRGVGGNATTTVVAVQLRAHAAGLANEATGPRGGGAAVYWRWLTACSRVLRSLPGDLLRRVLLCLGVGSGAAPIGSCGVCAVCDSLWPLPFTSLASHLRSGGHKTGLAAWRAAVKTSEECEAAAREAGIAACALAIDSTLVTDAAAAAAASSVVRAPRRWGRRSA